jgi:hypothetical protein
MFFTFTSGICDSSSLMQAVRHRQVSFSLLGSREKAQGTGLPRALRPTMNTIWEKSVLAADLKVPSTY